MLGKHSANGATSPILIYPHFTSKTVFQTVCGGTRLSSQNLGDSAGGSGIQGHVQLNGDFKTSLDRPLLISQKIRQIKGL